MKTETKYPLPLDVMEEVQNLAPKGFVITYEYPDFIGVWHTSWKDEDKFISLGDVNGHFGFNDVYADKVLGDMENIYEPKEIAKSFWNQLKEFYPNEVK